MTVEELNIIIRANSSQMQGQIDKVQKQVDGMAKNTKQASETMSSAFSRIGKAVTAIATSAAIASFGKQAIDLASDLQEVQNVVDTAFGDMSSQVDAWAKTTVSRFGVSELAAKQSASTYMAMSKGMGLVGQQAADMAMLAAERTGDIASFYNMSQQEADTLMKSIWSGETESLKRIGVVMTQTNLNAFAMAKGIGKTVDQMTQAEQVQLRYMYVMEQTSLAAGDFAKTSDSWANQTRVLSERWKEFMSIIGQNLIRVLTPAVRFLNNCLDSLIVIADYVSSVLATAFGWEKQEDTTKGTLAMADAEAELAEQTTAAAEAAKKATLGFDELNVLGSKSGQESADSSGDSFDFDAGETAVPIDDIEDPALSMRLEGWISKFKKKLGGIKTEFQNIFGPSYQIVKDSVKNIGKNFHGLAENAFDAGQNIVRSIADGVKQSKPEYEQGLSTLIEGVAVLGGSIGDVCTESMEVASESLANWTSENRKTITGFSASVTKDMGVVSKTIGNVFNDIGTSINDAWENGGKKAISKSVEAIANLGKNVMNLYTQWISPAIERISEGFGQLWDEHLKPLWDNILGFVNSVIICISTVWNNCLSPIIDWLITVLAPIVQWVVDVIWAGIYTVFAFISDVVSSLLKILRGLLDFITGVFSGDWEKAWQGIVDVFSGVFNGIWAVVKLVINSIIDGLNALWGGAYAVFAGIVNGAGGIVAAIGKAVGKDWRFTMPSQAPLIPKLAQGGLAHSATLAMIGEGNNDEAVLPLSDAVYQRIGAGISDSLDNSTQIALLREQNGILRQLLNKEFVATAIVSLQEILTSIDRANRKAGKTIIPIG